VPGAMISARRTRCRGSAAGTAARARRRRLMGGGEPGAAVLGPGRRSSQAGVEQSGLPGPAALSCAAPGRRPGSRRSATVSGPSPRLLPGIRGSACRSRNAGSGHERLIHGHRVLCSLPALSLHESGCPGNSCEAMASSVPVAAAGDKAAIESRHRWVACASVCRRHRRGSSPERTRQHDASRTAWPCWTPGRPESGRRRTRPARVG